MKPTFRDVDRLERSIEALFLRWNDLDTHDREEVLEFMRSVRLIILQMDVILETCELIDSDREKLDDAAKILVDVSETLSIIVVGIHSVH